MSEPDQPQPWWATPSEPGAASDQHPTEPVSRQSAPQPPAGAPSQPQAVFPSASTPQPPASTPPGGPSWWDEQQAYRPGGSAHYPGVPTQIIDRESANPPRRRSLAALAGGLAALIVVTAAVTGVTVHEVDHHSAAAGTTTVITKNAAPVTQQGSFIKSALATISPSVVIINTTIGGDDSSSLFDEGGDDETGSAAGTGIIYSANGTIVTNAHVIADATSIKVTLPSGQTVSAHVLGANTTRDLAAIKVDNVSNLTPAVFAATNTVQVGNQVIAVGNAEGYGGKPSVSSGIVSALNRSLPGETGNTLTGLIQTDAAINPGNSGGPLVDTAGHVIGIDTAIATGTRTEPAVNIGFAIPSDTITKNLPALINGSAGSSSGTAYLGVGLQDGLGGAQIVQVGNSTPASKAGLQAGDTITKIDGTKVSTASDAVGVIGRDKVGQQVQLTIQRATGDTVTVPVTLGSKPAGN